MTWIRSFRANGARLSVVAALVVAAVTSVADAGFIIDDFSDIQEPSQWPVVLNTLTTVTIDETGLGGVIGGNRTSRITATALDKEGLDNVTVTVAPVLGKLDYASTVGAQGSLELFYGGTPGRGGLGLDLSGQTQLEIQFVHFDFSDGSPLPVTITLLDSNENSMSLTRSLTSPGPHTLVFELADFTRGTFDLSSVASVDVFFEGALATDFRVEEFRSVVVPAPGVLALLGGGALARRRRRRG